MLDLVEKQCEEDWSGEIDEQHQSVKADSVFQDIGEVIIFKDIHKVLESNPFTIEQGIENINLVISVFKGEQKPKKRDVRED